MGVGVCDWRRESRPGDRIDEAHFSLAGVETLHQARGKLSRGRLIMCTVTFIARQRGYALGMNRDEKLTRPKGLPPQLRILNGLKVLCPSEPDGGNWIALNETGVTLALINWYSVAARVTANPVTRGEVVRTLNAGTSKNSIAEGLDQLPLPRINPFRLIGIFPAASSVVEWRWDLEQLVFEEHAWITQQWISSGFDESQAQRMRNDTFQRALGRTSAAGVNWLRSLHQSHTPEAGPFSTCMHRADAATVSYTEITVSPRVGTMRYYAGTPCGRECLEARSMSRSVLHLRPRHAFVKGGGDEPEGEVGEGHAALHSGELRGHG